MLFLFRRKLFYWARFALLFTGYDIKRRDFVEELYGLYVVIIMSVWLLVMAGLAVTTAAEQLARFHIQVSGLRGPVFYGLGLWLALSPWLAQRSYDLYRFALPDLDFLGSAPLRLPAVALPWFLKSLFSRWNGAVVLALGVLAGAEGQTSGTGDLLGLISGVAASAAFICTVSALVWMMGLLRYRPVPAFGPALGYSISALAVVVLFSLPSAPTIYLPAWLASSVVAGQPFPPGWLLPALGGLFAGALAGSIIVALVSRGTLLAPAFEEGRLGGQVRRAVGANSAAATQSAALSQAGSSRGREGVRPSLNAGSHPGGRIFRTLLVKQQMSLSHLPFMQLMLATVAQALLGGLAALSVLALPRLTTRIELLAPAAFFTCFALVRTGANVLRNDFAHIDFFAGWPITRVRLALYNTIIGFALPLLGGEAVLIGAIPLVGLPGVLLCVLWPLLVAASAAATLLDFVWQIRRWTASPETLPEAGPLPIAAASIVWLLILWGLSVLWALSRLPGFYQ